jgi:hypothetical protein
MHPETACLQRSENLPFSLCDRKSFANVAFTLQNRNLPEIVGSVSRIRKQLDIIVRSFHFSRSNNQRFTRAKPRICADLCVLTLNFGDVSLPPADIDEGVHRVSNLIPARARTLKTVASEKGWKNPLEQTTFLDSRCFPLAAK